MMRSRFPRLLPLAILAIALASAGAVAQDVQVGEKVPDHDFGPMLFGDGRTRLSEYIGQPVLLEWWGTR